MNRMKKRKWCEIIQVGNVLRRGCCWQKKTMCAMKTDDRPSTLMAYDDKKGQVRAVCSLPTLPPQSLQNSVDIVNRDAEEGEKDRFTRELLSPSATKICGEHNNSLINLILSPPSPPSAQCRKNNGRHSIQDDSLIFHVEQIMVDIDDDNDEEQC